MKTRAIYKNHTKIFCLLFTCHLQAEYCSEDCRKRAYEEYHKILCFNGEDPPEPVKILDEYWRYEQPM